nr:Armadillo type fold [Hymenolepis microstoma]
MDFAQILLAASSSDPYLVQSANVHLEELSKSDPLFLSKLVSAIFEQSDLLTPSALLLAIIHLKNIVKKWSNFDKNQQEYITSTILHHLQQNPSPNRFISEIIGIIFRQEWGREWPEKIWLAIIQSEAWTPLRRCIQRSAHLRLPMRRKVLSAQVADVLPHLISRWINSNNSELLHTIYTCVAVIDSSAITEIMSSNSAVFGELITNALVSLTSPGCKDCKRLAKLLHALFCLLPIDLRTPCVLSLLNSMTTVLDNDLADRKTVFWCMATVFNITSGTFRDNGWISTYPAFPYLNQRAKELVFNWYLSPSGKIPQHSNAVSLLLTLMRTWMPLSDSEMEALYSEPEACYSSGGVSCNDTVAGVSSNVFFAEAFWNTKLSSATANTDFIPVHPETVPLLRQLAESTFQLLARHLNGRLVTVLSSAIEELITNGEVALKEVGMRSIQFLLQIDSVQWCSHVDTILSITSANGSNIEPLIQGRRMALLVRRALIVSGSSDEFKCNCSVALIELASCLSISCENKKREIVLQLAAACNLAWFLENPSFPPDILSNPLDPTLSNLLASFANLAKNVEEDETKVLILRYLQCVFENGNIESNFGSFIQTLQDIWQMAEGGLQLRASLIDLVTTVMKALNSESVSPEVTSAAEQLTRVAVTSFIIPDLTRFIELGEKDDADMLADSCLLLWRALVTGSGARWSPTLEQLMPLLTDIHGAAVDETLYARVKTVDQAEIFFEIADACLRLASSSNFLSSWTEPFWSPALRGLITPDMLEAPFSSVYISQLPPDKSLLKLLASWCSQIIRHNVDFPPSICGLLILNSRICLLSEPVEIEGSKLFCDQMRLLCVAQLAASPNRWHFLMKLLTCVEGNVPPEKTFSQVCLGLSKDDHPIPADNQQQTLLALLGRLMDRMDSLSNRLHRRCFVLAAVFCLKHLAPSEHLFKEVSESVISLCVQALFETDENPTNSTEADSWVAPSSLANPEQLKASLISLLGNLVDTLSANVDPAVWSQFIQKIA